MPKPGFHQAMRALTEEFGILLIFDEVKTGFRFAQGRRRRVLRHHAGPRDVRQGDGQRLSGRGVRRPRGGHDASCPTRSATAARTPATGSPPRPRSRPSRSCATRTPWRRSTRPASGSRPACARSSTRRGLPYHFTGHPSMFGIMFTETRSRPSTATGRTRTTSCTTRSRSGCTPAARCPSRTAASRGSCARRTPRATSSTASLTIFSDSLDAALEARAHGAASAGAATAPCRTRRPAEPGTDDDGPRRERGPLGRPGGGPAARPRREPGRGRRDRARPPARASTSPRRRGCSRRSRSAASWSRTRRPASTGSASSSSASPSGPSGRSTCAAIAMPELERLARLTHETTGLGILDGDPLLTVAQADGPNLIAVGDWTGRGDAAPLRRVGQGPAVVARRARGPAHRPARPRSATRSGRSPSSSRSSRSWPGSAGAATRRRSASTTAGSTRSRRPVHDARGNVIAAVDIWGPAFRVTPRRVPELAAQAREAAGRDLGPARAARPPERLAARACRRRSHGSARAAAIALTDACDRTTAWRCPTSTAYLERCSSPSLAGSAILPILLIVGRRARRDPARARCSSTASSRRCSTARRPRARPRSCPRSRSRSGWTRSTGWAPTSSASFIVIIAGADGPRASSTSTSGRPSPGSASSASPSGFGAQSLVRDYLNGALILIENQFSKGDVISIAGVERHGRGLQPAADDPARPRRRRPHRAQRRDQGRLAT